MIVTHSQLSAIMPRGVKRIPTFLPYINKYLAEFHIDTPLRLAHYLAQIAHESGELLYTKELASGSAYEGRKDLGNTHPGDGIRYKGRGLIQLTGRANYQAYKEYCGFDVIKTPTLLELPLGAVRSSMWFWQTRGLNKLADADDVLAVTRRINGGTNGLASRQQYLARAKKALKIE